MFITLLKFYLLGVGGGGGKELLVESLTTPRYFALAYYFGLLAAEMACNMNGCLQLSGGED